MNKDLARILSRIGENHRLPSCRESGCRASMGGLAAPRLLFDARTALPAHGFKNTKLCDCILFVQGKPQQTVVAVPIELKKGNVRVSVAAQLESGVKFIESVVPKEIKIRCRPVLLHGGTVRQEVSIQLNKTKLNFRTRKITIAISKCNQRRNIFNALNP